MSVKQLNAVFEDSLSEGAAFQVAIAMADWADHGGWCYPSYSQIMRKAHIRSRSTVLKALETLEALGELKIFPKGHAPNVVDEDDIAPPVARQFRNLYRLTIIKPRGYVSQPTAEPEAEEVVRNSNHLFEPEVDRQSNHLDEPEVVRNSNHLKKEVVRSLDEGSSIIEPGGSSILDAHIRNSPSVLSVNEPSAEEAAAAGNVDAAVHAEEIAAEVDDFEAMRLAWNSVIERESRLVPVHELTADRRAKIQHALTERPLVEWEHIFGKVGLSSFLNGYGRQSFIADMWWTIGKPEASIAILEGKYDDHFSDAELRAAGDALFNSMGGCCPHRNGCDDTKTCVRRFALSRRWAKVS